MRCAGINRFLRRFIPRSHDLQGRQARPETRMRLVAGLGNPGPEYRATRHNAGFMAVEKIAETYSIPLASQKFGAVFGCGHIQNIPVVLIKPLSFMNRSGPPVKAVAEHFRIYSRDMVIIHDDIDLALGRLKIKQKGGHGGHKGIGSLIDALGGGDFVRLRIGIGRGGSSSAGSVVDHVLGRFSDAEGKLLEQVLLMVCEAAATILSRGTLEGMNLFNAKEGKISR